MSMAVTLPVAVMAVALPISLTIALASTLTATLAVALAIALAIALAVAGLHAIDIMIADAVTIRIGVSGASLWQKQAQTPLRLEPQPKELSSPSS